MDSKTLPLHFLVYIIDVKNSLTRNTVHSYPYISILICYLVYN